MRKFSTLILLGTLLSSAQAQLNVPGFTTYLKQGYQVLVNDAALAQQPAVSQEALAYLDTLLFRVKELGLAPDILDSLQAIPIFMEYALTSGSAWYHYDANWLIQNGYNPAKAHAVEIANMSNFLSWSRQNQPWMILHELAHGYNDRVLGLQYAPILQAYTSALASGLYNSVLYNPGGGNPPFSQPAYARTNALEYFAEITESYLGENDYDPFDSLRLKTYDPAGYALTKSVWRFSGSTSAAPEVHPWQFRVYPNPAQEFLRVESRGGGLELRLSDLAGRELMADRSGGGELRLDLSALPAGLYVLTLRSGGRQEQRLIEKV
jgi:hypothetical protein